MGSVKAVAAVHGTLGSLPSELLCIFLKNVGCYNVDKFAVRELKYRCCSVLRARLKRSCCLLRDPVFNYLSCWSSVLKMCDLPLALFILRESQYVFNYTSGSDL